jgi:hypothetical protein
MAQTLLEKEKIDEQKILAMSGARERPEAFVEFCDRIPFIVPAVVQPFASLGRG